ncbi:MAG: glucose-6-phosphate isomerase [Elusimicrobia bacterium]|jgi:glucose-6-phosphate isomerase|nr:glucose-6-phosphate isomerase [Elusimicrobiota bacterium]
MIELDYRNCLAARIGSEGISEEKLESVKKQAFAELENIKKNPPGFMKLPVRFDEARKIREDAKKYRDFKNLVVLGIGGSALGNITLKNMLTHTYHNQGKNGGYPNLYVLDNVDPEWTSELSDIIDLKDTVFNVITKSGSTAETLSNFFFFLEKLKKERSDWKDHLVFTTGNKGFLREFADENGIKTYSVPEDVGGRYSVLSEVGLFPAAVTGLNIESLLEGAADAEENEHVPVTYAALQYYFYKKGKNISVFMPYSKKLESTADWFRQLWAESLGKNEKTGPTPVKAIGTTDQHSQVQLYMEGPKDKVFTFLSVKDSSPEVKLKYDGHFLGGKTMRGLFNAELEGTTGALTKEDRPNMNFEIPKIDAYNAGELLYQLEMACAITGGMLGIDPFNQPGVELGKKLAYEILEKNTGQLI